MADHFMEVVGLRLTDLEARVQADAVAVSQQFAEFREFVTFGLDRLGADLRQEMRAGFARVDARFAEVEARFSRIDDRFAAVEARLDRMDDRFDRLEQKLNVHIEVSGQAIRHLEQQLDAHVETTGQAIRHLERKVGDLERKVGNLERKAGEIGQKLDELIAVVRRLDRSS